MFQRVPDDLVTVNCISNIEINCENEKWIPDTNGPEFVVIGWKRWIFYLSRIDFGSMKDCIFYMIENRLHFLKNYYHISFPSLFIHLMKFI